MTSDRNGYGALRFPVGDGDFSAATLDPGKIAIGELVAAAINAELGAKWSAIMSAIPAGHHLVAQGNSTPVGVISPVEVTPQQMMQWKAKWPLLAVYRQGEPAIDELTTHYNKLTQEWSVDYILGPLTTQHQVTIGTFCTAVGKVIATVIDRGYHPDVDSGKRRFFGQFSSIRCKSIHGPGVAQSLGEESGSGYYGMTVILETVERSVFDGYAATDEFETYTGYVPVGTGTATALSELWLEASIENQSDDV